MKEVGYTDLIDGEYYLIHESFSSGSQGKKYHTLCIGKFNLCDLKLEIVQFLVANHRFTFVNGEIDKPPKQEWFVYGYDDGGKRTEGYGDQEFFEITKDELLIHYVADIV